MGYRFGPIELGKDQWLPDWLRGQPATDPALVEFEARHRPGDRPERERHEREWDRMEDEDREKEEP